MQIDFMSPEGYFARKGYDTSPLCAIIDPIKRLPDAARAAGALIILTRRGYCGAPFENERPLTIRIRSSTAFVPAARAMRPGRGDIAPPQPSICSSSLPRVSCT